MAVNFLAAVLIGLFLAATASAQTGEKPLFARDEILRLTISGPITSMAQPGAKTRPPRNAVLSVAGPAPETHAIWLSPRGITRLKRDVCQFPPLRVRFQQTPGPGLVFSGQKQLKLVTHCRSPAAFQQHLLLEYAAYRLYNLLTPASFRARLAMIDYVSQDNRPVASRLGFFIEEIEDVAARNGMRRAATGDSVPVSQLSSADSVRVALFQYLIGNMDWSIRAGPAGERCCHNSRLLVGAGRGTKLVPAPYDFDYSGLVNAPYAVAPDGESDVRVRRYQGYCAHNAEALAFAATMRAQRTQLVAVLSGIPLEESVRRKAAAYLEGFFSDIADDQRIASRLFKTCVK